MIRKSLLLLTAAAVAATPSVASARGHDGYYNSKSDKKAKRQRARALRYSGVYAPHRTRVYASSYYGSPYYGSGYYGGYGSYPAYNYGGYGAYPAYGYGGYSGYGAYPAYGYGGGYGYGYGYGGGYGYAPRSYGGGYGRCGNPAAGAALGGVAGAVIGSQVADGHHRYNRYGYGYRNGGSTKGAIIGGALGAVVGGAIASNNC